MHLQHVHFEMSFMSILKELGGWDQVALPLHSSQSLVISYVDLRGKLSSSVTT